MKPDITNTAATDSQTIATAVSIRATRETLDALLVIAAKRRCAVADIVAEAVEIVFGAEIREVISFFAASDYKNSHAAKNPDEVQP